MDPLLNWDNVIISVKTKVIRTNTKVYIQTKKQDKYMLLITYSHKKTQIKLPDMVNMKVIDAYAAIKKSITNYLKLTQLIDPSPDINFDPASNMSGGRTVTGRFKVSSPPIQSVLKGTKEHDRINNIIIDDLENFTWNPKFEEY